VTISRAFRRDRHAPPAARGLRADRGSHITANDFGAFAFTNAVELWGTQNPGFFESTRVTKEAAAILAAVQTRTSPRPNNPGIAAPPHGGAVSPAGVFRPVTLAHQASGARGLADYIKL